jgi:hypothetical protein
MTQTSYASQVWAAIKSPDGWDLGGLGFTNVEQSWKEFGQLVGKMRAGQLDDVAASRVLAQLRAMADGWSAMAVRIASINVPATTGDEKAMKAFFIRKAQEAQRYVQQAAISLDEGVAGYVSRQALFDNLSKLAKLGGTALGKV